MMRKWFLQKVSYTKDRGDTQKMLHDILYSHMYVWSDTFNSLIVCSRAHDLFALFVFACVFWCPTHIVLYFSSSCVPYVASFSGLSIFDCPSVFSKVYHVQTYYIDVVRSEVVESIYRNIYFLSCGVTIYCYAYIVYYLLYVHPPNSFW